MITVRILQVPGAVKEIVMDSGTIADAISHAGITRRDNDGIFLYNEDVSGDQVSDSYELADGDRVHLAAMAKAA